MTTWWGGAPNFEDLPRWGLAVVSRVDLSQHTFELVPDTRLGAMAIAQLAVECSGGAVPLPRLGIIGRRGNLPHVGSKASIHLVDAQFTADALLDRSRISAASVMSEDPGEASITRWVWPWRVRYQFNAMGPWTVTAVVAAALSIVLLLEHQQDLEALIVEKVQAAQIHKDPYFKSLESRTA